MRAEARLENTFNVIPENRAGKTGRKSWSTADRRLVAEVTAMGVNKAIADGARALIAKHSATKSSRSPQVGAGRPCLQSLTEKLTYKSRLPLMGGRCSDGRVRNSAPLAACC